MSNVVYRPFTSPALVRKLKSIFALCLLTLDIHLPTSVLGQPADSRTCSGEDFADCVAWADREAKVGAVGVNCTAPRHISSLLAIACKHTSKVWVGFINTL